MKRKKERPRDLPRGMELLHDPALNKGTAFSESEREALGLSGLLPPRVCGQQQQVLRVMGGFRSKAADLEKYVFMAALQDRNETLFYRVVIDHIEEMMPIIYTPTVGKACQEYGHIFQRPRGIFVARGDRGRIARVLENWANRDVRVIVVTDGERILGLGDLGANGMGIPVGKLALYTACAGVRPTLTLPVMLDVGTDNDELKKDPLYIGTLEQRLRGKPYDELVDEFIASAEKVFPGVLIQFEDFAGSNAFRLLDRYRNHFCAFNDDIQGTAAVTLAGLYSALRITKQKLEDQKILFLGAGEAGTGIGNLVASAMMRGGLSEEDALRRCWFVDSKGLVVAGRTDLAEHKRRFAHEHEPLPDFASAVRALKPTAIIGVSGQPRTFTREVLEMMAGLNERPIVFALSNPTSHAECTAEEAYEWTAGRALFASGSPFDPVTLDGKTYTPGQANNAYIFPGVGLGVIACGVRRVTDDMFFAAARALAGEVSESDLAQGALFPPLRKIRDVSLAVAVSVAEKAFDEGLVPRERPADLRSHIQSQMYEPTYRSYV